MRIDIWSDVVCPWCYIGKRRLERALESFEHADEVELVYRSFELDPSAPAVGSESVVEHLGKKYGGGPAAGQQMMDQMAATADEEGLTFDYADATHTKTIDAHRLLHLALEAGGNRSQGELKEALMATYFTQGESMGDHDVLRKVAVDVGLEPARVDDVLGSQQYADAVEVDIAQARTYGVSGVPFYVVDGAYGVSGAQPSEVLVQVLGQAWSASHPALSMVDTHSNDHSHEGDVCGPDGCQV